MDVKNIWPRISGLAQQYGIEAPSENDWPELCARGSDGRLYDVCEIVDAIRADNQERRKTHEDFIASVRS